ncbi:hypothetical protein GCM10010174_61810 [Kutzneria viridogrisea]|uniref:Uncharacterized protein n=1 Tax=Kutzneria viridogrisea TaxID=47990 RepID=A0ABR6BGL3_9PSEU|nr:hypothetical protein [Kutzneria viridogrisea]
MNIPADDPTDIDEYLSQTDYFECRAYGHTFRSKDLWWDIEGSGTTLIYTKTFDCPSCGMSRTDTRDRSRRLIARSYGRIPGYAVKGRRLSRDDVWAWQIEQQLAQQRGRRRRAA